MHGARRHLGLKRGVAQSGRALALGAIGRRFESCFPGDQGEESYFRLTLAELAPSGIYPGVERQDVRE